MSSTASIGGLATGLDTQSIIAQLIKLERIPIQQLQVRQARLAQVDAAWGDVVSRMSALRGAVDGVRSKSTWDTFYSASSSDSTAVGATVTGTPLAGAVSFTVQALAYAEQQASPTADAFSSLTDFVSGKSLTINFNDGTPALTITDDGDDTLQDFVTRINDAGKPVRAQAVAESDGSYRLVLTAKTTGTANGFTLSGLTNWDAGGFQQVQAAQNSVLQVGGTSPMTITRSTNTVSDFIEGVRLDLKNTTTDPVTITTARDNEKAVSAVKKLVDEVNSMLSTLGKLTKADSKDSSKSGPLVGDATARRLVQDLRTAMSSVVTGLTGDYTTPGSIGISLTQDGQLKLDESKLRTALDDDFAAVSKLMTRAGTATDSRVRWSVASNDTKAGTYTVRLTTAAALASHTGTVDYAAPAPGNTETVTITYAGKTINAVIDENDTTVADAVQAINDQLTADGVTTLKAEVSGNRIKLSTTTYGSAATFTVSTTGADPYGLDGTYNGVDAVAVVDGQTITGEGQRIEGPSGDIKGLVMRISATQAEVDAAAGDLDLGTITYSRGIGGEVSARISAFEGIDGAIQLTRNRIDDQVKTFQTRIDLLEVRVANKERALVARFTAMETAMSRLISQGNWLSSQLGSLQANNSG